MGDPDALTPSDQVNLVLEGVGVYVLTIVGLAGVGGVVAGPDQVDLDSLRAAIDERSARAPRLRRTLAGEAGAYRLVDAGLRIEDHVRAVDPVEGMTGLHALCGELAARPLPHDRPLWELLIVPGAHPAGTAWVFRVHHAIADGAEAVRLMDALFDPVEDEPPARPPAARAVPRRRGPALRQLGTLVRPMRRTRLVGPSGPGRDLRVTRVPLAAASRTAHALGVTINDLALAAVGEGARAAFAVLGEPVPRVIPAQVPVILPGGTGLTNQVAAFTARIPLGDVGPVRRARQLGPATRAGTAAVRGRPLPWFVRTPAGARLMRGFVARQRVIGVLTTNVRGPSQPRALCGAPVDAVWALPVLAGTVRVGTAVVSYAGTLAVCVLWADELGKAGEAMAAAVADAWATLTAGGDPRIVPGKAKRPSG